jgi:phosphoribosylanthranilate isomerase
MTWVKICGITNMEDALRAASLGIDALGFVFAPSPRKVDPEIARKIIRALPKTLLNVGIFVNEKVEEVRRVAKFCNLNALQFHGEESAEYLKRFSLPILKAIHIQNLESLRDIGKYDEVSLLLDTNSPLQAGGTGNLFPWEVALIVKEKRDFILSGGLSPLNVREAIMKVRPWGVDVSSGVELFPGKKDLLKMSKFVKEVKKADETTG